MICLFRIMLFLLSLGSLNAQLQSIAHRYLIKLKNDQDISAFRQSNKLLADYEMAKINSHGNILQIIFPDHFSQEQEHQLLNSNGQIEFWQQNFALNKRGCNPNDSAYFAQYNLELMKFDEVWCYSTTGLSPFGDTLVVGVIDQGFNFELEDMLPNIFINHSEIADNLVDDDQNGYRDDYYGLNGKSFNAGDDHPFDNHGTQVISVVGAKGDNTIDISGSNQNIKILLCSASTSDQLLRCYYYFIDMKRAYLNSGGTKGAFMVSSNLSAGFDGYFPEDFPLICQVYDSLGAVGILNSAATINDNKDIGNFGDIPGLCPSEHLIVVTNTNRFDQKVTSAGFNKTHVDIGACGEDIPMLNLQGKVTEESGCSFSSPHVAGAISLLYQFCPALTLLNKTNPAQANNLVRSLLLNCGDPINGLKGITSSEKRLNVFSALECLTNYCINDTSETKIALSPTIGTGQFKLKFNPEKFGNYKLFIYNTLGQFIYNKYLNFKPDSPYEHVIELEYAVPGVYHLLIEGEGKEFSQSFVKI